MNKIWIYQADRFLTDAETLAIDSLTQTFVAGWAAHGSALAALGYIKYNLFLILEVDERQAGVTGCSIDSSVHFIQGLEKDFRVGFFDRTKVSYKDESGNVRLVSRHEFEELIALGKVTADTLVFNNLVQQGEELQHNWEIPLRDSWHSKVF